DEPEPRLLLPGQGRVVVVRPGRVGELVEDRIPHVFEIRRHGGRSPLVGVQWRGAVRRILGVLRNHTLSTGSDAGPAGYPHGCPRVWKRGLTHGDRCGRCVTTPRSLVVTCSSGPVGLDDGRR